MAGVGCNPVNWAAPSTGPCGIPKSEQKRACRDTAVPVRLWRPLPASPVAYFPVGSLGRSGMGGISGGAGVGARGQAAAAAAAAAL